jgi:ribosomal protein S18 acetylase RimI-like enzyme
MKNENTFELQNGVKIERAIEGDFVEVEKLLYETWLTTYPNSEFGITKEDIETIFSEEEKKKQIEKHVAEFKKNLPNIHTFVAKKDGKVIGFCKIIEENDFYELDYLYVSTDLQGQGIGTLLWKEAKKVFTNKNKKIILKVISYNEKAIRFYKSLGFEVPENSVISKDYQMPISKNYLPEIEMILKI